MHPAASWRLLNALLRESARHQTGFVLPFALLAGIVIVIAAILLATRANYSLLGSNRQLLFTSAREAAEFGFSEAVAKLNTDRYGYLLVTNWDQWQNTNPISDGDGDCDLAIYDAEPALKFNGIASNATNAWRVLPAQAGQPTARYQITNYVAPRPVSTACNAEGYNGTNTRFGNVWGGDGLITIRGELINADNQVQGQFTLTRKVHVKAFAGPGEGESSLVVSKGADLNRSNLYFDSNGNGVYDSPPDYWLDIYCVDCEGTTQAELRSELGIPLNDEYGGTIYKGAFNYGTYPTPDFSSLPTPPVYNRNTTGLNIFPYADAGLTTLRPECKNATINDVDQVICRVERIDFGAGSNVLRARTAAKPVSIFLTGSGASNPVLNLSGNDQIVNNEYSSTNTNAFARLRIFGLNDPTYNDGEGEDPCNLQTTNIVGTDAIRGAFMWFPNGTLSFTGGGNQAANYYGILWGCRYTGNSNSVNFIGPRNGAQILQSELNADIPLGTVRYRAQGVMDPG